MKAILIIYLITNILRLRSRLTDWFLVYLWSLCFSHTLKRSTNIDRINEEILSWIISKGKLNILVKLKKAICLKLSWSKHLQKHTHKNSDTRLWYLSHPEVKQTIITFKTSVRYNKSSWCFHKGRSRDNLYILIDISNNGWKSVFFFNCYLKDIIVTFITKQFVYVLNNSQCLHVGKY